MKLVELLMIYDYRLSGGCPNVRIKFGRGSIDFGLENENDYGEWDDDRIDGGLSCLNEELLESKVSMLTVSKESGMLEIWLDAYGGGRDGESVS